MDPCWIKCFLGESYCVNGQLSSPSAASSAMLQGSVLGPFLFYCYINNITYSASSSVKLYADDVFMVYRLLLIATADDCKML